MNEDNDPADDPAGDQARRRLAAIYDRHHRQVHAYALSRAGGALADDVVSETFRSRCGASTNCRVTRCRGCWASPGG